jgi:hypothetical protein
MYIKKFFVPKNGKQYGPYYEIADYDTHGDQIIIKYIGSVRTASLDPDTDSQIAAERFIRIFKNQALSALKVNEDQLDELLKQDKHNVIIMANAVRKYIKKQGKNMTGKVV